MVLVVGGAGAGGGGGDGDGGCGGGCGGGDCGGCGGGDCVGCGGLVVVDLELNFELGVEVEWVTNGRSRLLSAAAKEKLPTFALTMTKLDQAI